MIFEIGKVAYEKMQNLNPAYQLSWRELTKEQKRLWEEIAFAVVERMRDRQNSTGIDLEEKKVFEPECELTWYECTNPICSEHK